MITRNKPKHIQLADLVSAPCLSVSLTSPKRAAASFPPLLLVKAPLGREGGAVEPDPFDITPPILLHVFQLAAADVQKGGVIRVCCCTRLMHVLTVLAQCF
jgi:hypothetical protein